MARTDATLLGELREIAGAEHVIEDPDVLAGAVVDWTGRFRGASPALVRPGSAREVGAVVASCRRRGQALTLQGGNTGLVGGATPLHGEILLSLRRFTGIEIDPGAGQARAGAGVSIGELQRAAAGAGWTYGVDLASRDSATVGGTVATNAGGVHVLRWGDTRAQLLGVAAVLGDGSEVSRLGGLVKDNTGYDLPGLICGSEGTLGIVTEVCLRLVPPARQRIVALVALAGLAEAVAAAGLIRRESGSVSAIELFTRSGLELVCRQFGLPDPFDRPHRSYLLVELAGTDDPEPELLRTIADLPRVEDAVVASDSIRRSELWRYRELHTEAINSLGPPHKLDVTLPHRRLAEFVSEVPGAVASVAPAAATWIFGHAADGNVHVNVTGLAPDDDRVDEMILRMVCDMDGSISAEHGIGVAKRPYLGWNRSEAELSAFRRIKAALDPDRILNPNLLLPETG